MSNKIWTICCVISCALGVALAIYSAVGGECGGVLECTTGNVPMKCHWTFLAVAGLGGAQAILSAVALLQKEATSRRVAGIGILIMGVLAILLLYVIMGVCANASMTCNTGRTIALVIELANIVAIAIAMAKADPKVDAMPKAKL